MSEIGIKRNEAKRNAVSTLADMCDEFGREVGEASFELAILRSSPELLVPPIFRFRAVGNAMSKAAAERTALDARRLLNDAHVFAAFQPENHRQIVHYNDF